MAKVCQITGRKRMIGYNVAHSKLRTKRDFALNLKTKKFWSEAEQRFITLKVSCKGMRTIEKKGLDAALKQAQDKGCRPCLKLFELWQRKQKETGCRSSSNALSRRKAEYRESPGISPQRTRRTHLSVSSVRSTILTSTR